MNRERQAIMDKARARRLRRRTSSNRHAPGPETAGLGETLRTLAGTTVGKLTDLAGQAAHTARSVVGLDDPTVKAVTK